MTHVLVRWITERAWDVYSVRALVDAELSVRLLTEENTIKKVRGEVVSVRWKDGEAPAEAELLDFGSERSMEKKRANLAKAAVATKEPEAAAEDHSVCQCDAAKKLAEMEDYIKNLEDRLHVAEDRLQMAENNAESFAMVKKASKLVRRLQALQEAPRQADVPKADTEDIGGGVMVEKTVISRLHAHCQGLPTKFARSLLRNVFTDEELRQKSLYGKGTNAYKEGPAKDGLDPVRLNAVLGMHRFVFE
ncbi:hypothetical protein V5799_009459 [Amblyomma americanum]|uniref:BEN domain-containing protein n=1 Tax=Amblyomma americanum TaxID=6943 RepID=A0AAQ4FAD1_AMBAM